MIPVPVWRLLHLFFAFAFVGTLVVAEANGRAARKAKDWALRSQLWGIVGNTTSVGGVGSLLALGVLGNLLAIGLGYRMSADGWLRWVNGLWLLAVLVQAVVVAPGASRLAGLARTAAGGGRAEGYDAAARRWRVGNLAQSLLYLVFLFLMVFHHKS